MIGGLLLFDAHAADVASLRFGGLRMVERHIRTMTRAGVERLLVILPAGVTVPRLGAVTQRLDLELEFVSHGQVPEVTFAAQDTVLLLLGDHVHHHSSLRALVDAGREASDIVAQTTSVPESPGLAQSQPAWGLQITDAGMSLVPQIPDTQIPDTRPADMQVATGAFLCDGSVDLNAVVASATGSDAINAIGHGARATTSAGDSALWKRVTDRASARQARAMLFGQVTKKTSGPVSRHINARLSIPISKVLIETGISPHMVTVLFVLTSGLATAWLIARPESYGRVALAGLCWQMAAVLDRCDGEIARVKLCESKFGAWFDTVTDNIAYLATYVAFLFGVNFLHPDKPWALYAGFSAIGAMIVALGIMYNYALKTGSGSLQNYLVGFRSHVPASEKNSIYRLLERYAFIAKRDFFAFVHFLCCLAGSFELLYAYTVGGLHLIVLAVLISQRKMLDGHRRIANEPGTSEPVAETAGR